MPPIETKTPSTENPQKKLITVQANGSRSAASTKKNVMILSNCVSEYYRRFSNSTEVKRCHTLSATELMRCREMLPYQT